MARVFGVANRVARIQLGATATPQLRHCIGEESREIRRGEVSREGRGEMTKKNKKRREGQRKGIKRVNKRI